MYIINIRRHLQTHSGRVLLLTLTLLALYLRTRALSSDPRVVWDAVHFGTFANNYIHREFFLDVHQPFGRLLITLLFQMFGYTGDYTFVSGENYSTSVPFVQMRAVQAVVGTLLVPLSFAMCQALRMPLVSVWLAAVFVTLENAFIGIARLNVLDNMLLVASAGAVSAFAVVERMHTKQRICTSHIIMLGLALALLLNIKLTGVLTAAVIAVYVLNMLVCTDYCKQSIQKITVIWIKYALLLGVVPVAIYVITFWWHFAWQTNYTPQADNMGSEFSVQLNGSALQIQPPFIYGNSFITMRSTNYPFEYLDVREYQDNRTKKLELSTSRVFNVGSYLGIALLDRTGVVNDKSLVALNAPNTEYFVSALDMQMSEIPSRRVGFVEYTSEQDSKPIAWKVVHEACTTGRKCATRPITTHFRLVSLEHGCELNINYLHLFEPVQLNFNCPWLLSCTHGHGTIWSIEHQLATTDYPTANISQRVHSNFIQNFVTYNRLMYDINRMLISDPDLTSNIESAAWSWPFLLRPMQLVSWSGDELKYMLVGNVVLWRGSAIVCVLHPFVLLMSHIVRHRSRGKVVYRPPWSMNLVWILWAANYLPLMIVSRVTYGHQYLTSLYFGIILLAAYINQAARLLTSKPLPDLTLIPRNVTIGALVLVILGFVFSYPLTYGIFNPCDYTRYTWIPSWNVCRHPLY